LLLYQAALSAYFVVIFWVAAEKVSEGEKISDLIKSMKYWVYTLSATAILYLPIAFNIRYTKVTEKTFVGDNFSEYFDFFFKKICFYFESIYGDWRDTHVGILIFVFIIGFVAHFFSKMPRSELSRKSLAVRSVFLSILIFAFFLSPIGITIFFNHAGAKSDAVPSRIIYSIVPVIFIILHKASLFFEKKFFWEAFSKTFAIVFLVWSMVFSNVSGNLMKQKYELQNSICYDIAKDIYFFLKKQRIDKAIVDCNFTPIFFTGVMNSYPILNKIFTYQWSRPFFSNILLKYCGNFFPFVEMDSTNIPSNLTEIADHMWYTLYYCENNTLVIKIKN
jgi:hypothetical protein